jgi:hypothetical protein
MEYRATVLPNLETKGLRGLHSKKVVVNDKPDDVKTQERTRTSLSVKPPNFWHINSSLKLPLPSTANASGSNGSTTFTTPDRRGVYPLPNKIVVLDKPKFYSEPNKLSRSIPAVLEANPDCWLVRSSIWDYVALRVQVESTNAWVQDRHISSNSSFRALGGCASGALGSSVQADGRNRQDKSESGVGNGHQFDPPINRRVLLYFGGLVLTYALCLLGTLRIQSGRRLTGWALVLVGGLCGLVGTVLFALTGFRWSWGWWL